MRSVLLLFDQVIDILAMNLGHFLYCLRVYCQNHLKLYHLNLLTKYHYLMNQNLFYWSHHYLADLVCLMYPALNQE